MTLELARALYFRELDAKAQNDSRVGPYVALLTAIGGALVFLIGRSWPATTPLLQVSITLSLISIVVLLMAVLWVLHSLAASFDYEYLPSAEVLLGPWRDLSRYFARNSDAAGTPREDFDDSLLARLSSAATTNGANNRIRSARLHVVGRLLILVVVLLAGAAALLAAETFVSWHSQTGASIMADTPKPAQPVTTPPGPPAPQPAPAADTKPVMPQNVLQKGGAEKPTPSSLRKVVTGKTQKP